MNYTSIINKQKGAKQTFYVDASREESASGLTVANMVAAVEDGTSASISTQSYNATDTELSYMVSFNEAGETIISVTTTFAGTEETMVNRLLFRTIDPRLRTLRDYR